MLGFWIQESSAGHFFFRGIYIFAPSPIHTDGPLSNFILAQNPACNIPLEVRLGRCRESAHAAEGAQEFDHGKGDVLSLGAGGTTEAEAESGSLGKR